MNAWVILLTMATSVHIGCVSGEIPPGAEDEPGQGPVVVDQVIVAGRDDVALRLSTPGLPTPSPSPSPSPSGSAGVALVTRSFTESTAVIDNPERGFYVGYNLVGASTSSANSVRSGGHTVAIGEVVLDAYRDADLPASLLTSIDNGFAAARSAGIKIVLRFMYNTSMSADASRDRILGHIAQLRPILQKNADVIAVMQAGFIGAWGEWHSSTNGLDNDSDRSIILKAVLAALPASRQVQVRTPMHKAGIFPGGALTTAEAFTTSERARVGHHNDCFLASSSDYGTYASPVSTWEAYVAADGRFTAIGGETCAVYSPRTDCPAALAEMSQNHWSYLNQQYNQSVLSSWTSQGCMETVQKRLGYRFALERVASRPLVAPGGELAFEADIFNHGFAAPFNARPVKVVLSSGSTRLVATLAGVDARRWAAGERTTLAARLRVPAGLAPGTYQLALWLPDAAPTLESDPRQAIQLANAGVWVPATGANVLAEVRIDASAPGVVDSSARDFVQLP